MSGWGKARIKWAKIPKAVQTDFPVGCAQSGEEEDGTAAQHAEGPGQARATGKEFSNQYYMHGMNSHLLVSSLISLKSVFHFLG